MFRSELHPSESYSARVDRLQSRSRARSRGDQVQEIGYSGADDVERTNKARKLNLHLG